MSKANPTKGMRINLDELLGEATSSISAVRCWAAKVQAGDDEPLKKFLDAIESNRDRVVLRRVVVILSREFGLQLGMTSVRNHLRGECTCPKKT